MARRLGIKPTLKGLRSYSATELITAGVDIRTVAGRLGHSGGGTTTLRVYAAWVAEADQRAAQALSTRMPLRPTVLSRAERAKVAPEAPYEKIAADLRRQIIDGQYNVGDVLPTNAQLAQVHGVNVATANRATGLLKTWGLVIASKGRPTVVAKVADDQAQDAVAEAVTAVPDPAGVEPLSSQMLNLEVRRLGHVVSQFSIEANPTDPQALRMVLSAAIRRSGGREIDIADYEMDVRQAARPDILLATFVAM